ncbi:hypothetical protein [Sphingomonas sp.]|uniref:hypothetical protein n=1 Tax=Sphingomonas sp. TaxID=28214 RepID=UPI003B001466
MTGLFKKAVLGTAMAASAFAASAPADAQYRGYRGGYGHHRGGIGAGGAAVLGGIIGLGVGAAIASNDRGRYYDRGYYNDAPPPRAYYYDDYRANYDYQPRCYYQRQYDRWSGRPYDVRVCN